MTLPPPPPSSPPPTSPPPPPPPAGPGGPAAEDRPDYPTRRWLWGHTLFGLVLLITAAVVAWQLAVLIYLAVGAAAWPLHVRSRDRDRRYARGLLAKAGWAVLLPVYVTGVVVHGVVEAASSLAP